MNALATALVNLVVLAAIFIPLERAWPARPDQAVMRPALALDACFFFGQYLLTSAASLTTLGLVGGVLRHHGSVLRVASSLPAYQQIVIAIVLGDFVVYWFHRACHRFDLLWRFHAVHHSSEHLDWLAAHREHPLDGISTQLCMNLPAMLLGVHLPLLAGVAVLRGLWAILVHANVRLPLGPLRYLLGDPALHHWHHARLEAGARTHNFGNLAPYLDIVFGTHHRPKEEERYRLGLDEAFAPNWLSMMLRPFGLTRIGHSTTQTFPVPQCAVLPVHGLAKHSLGMSHAGLGSLDASAVHAHTPLHSMGNVRQSPSLVHFGARVSNVTSHRTSPIASLPSAVSLPIASLPSVSVAGESLLAVSNDVVSPLAVSAAVASPSVAPSALLASDGLESMTAESKLEAVSARSVSATGWLSSSSPPQARVEEASKSAGRKKPVDFITRA